ncbi:hypothetical protein ACOMHN_015178 [Nucella lapillus]
MWHSEIKGIFLLVILFLVLPMQENEEEIPPKDSTGLPEEDKEEEARMEKIAFAGPKHSFVCSERLNYMPHVVLIMCLMAGTVFMLTSVGSNHWMEARVLNLTVHYGLFERCVTIPSPDITICEPFDWPGWLYGTTQAEKMVGVKVLSIVSILFACLFSLGALLLLLTSSCEDCHGWRRKASLIVVDICLWLMITSAAVSSLLFLTGTHSVEAYPASVVLWPPVLYCCGWSVCLVCRLVIAACCDVHNHSGDTTMPFA